mmetsp:Transcript_41065/g.81048  ORF Transcript_41065/g.81048 Transcript_41065/m.81048 type:complete len:449 (+) Transcript_41065:34-1380(+)
MRETRVSRCQPAVTAAAPKAAAAAAAAAAATPTSHLNSERFRGPCFSVSRCILTLLLQVFLCNAQDNLVTASDYWPTVQYTVGYEAAGHFKHVSGSACCVQPPFKVDSPGACRQTCLSLVNCGAFIFSPATSDCYHADQEANLSPVDGPDACERRCRGQADCEAFVFAPSTQLCYLVQFTQDSLGLEWNVSVRPAEDRIFGLVRDRKTGILLKGLDQRSATDAQALHSLTTHGFAIVGLAVIFWAARISGKKVFLCHMRSFLLSARGWAAAFVVAADFMRSTRVLRPPTRITESVSAVVRWPHRRIAAMAHKPNESVADLERETHDATMQRPSIDHKQHTRHSQDPSGLRFRIPTEREVDWAGPTNYPVMGNVSPNVRGSPREPLFTVCSLDPMSDPSGGVDRGPNLGRISWTSFFGVHRGPLHGCLLMLGATCLAVLILGRDHSRHI